MNVWNVVERNRMYRFAINEFCESPKKLFPLGHSTLLDQRLRIFAYLRTI